MFKPAYWDRLGHKKKIKKKFLILVIFPTRWELYARARARARKKRNGQISGTVTPIKLKFGGLFRTPKMNLYSKF